jgi:integrase
MFSTYLQHRNGHYHLRVRTPVDLLGIIPKPEIIKSLRTTNLRTAKASALPYLHGIRQTATLVRLKYITSEQAQDSLRDLLKWKPKALQGYAKEVTEAQGEGIKAHILSSVIKTYVSDKENDWTPKTLMENTALFRLIVALIGDVPVESIDRGTVRSFKDKLVKLPPNVSKLYPRQSPLEVIKMIDSGKTIVSATLSIKSVNKHLSQLFTLMKHCVEEGYRTDNPASGMNIKQHRRQDEERKAYSREDIQKILLNLPTQENKPERYWVPLICMYSGMRLDEACQIYKSDVVKHQDVWCFDVNDAKDKKLKNPASGRLIPIHARLIELGFLEHVGRCSDNEQLWKNLKWCKLSGHSNSLGKWFQRFNREHVTADPRKTLHSLRHSFADSLKQQLVAKSIVAELMGHSDHSETFSRYGKRFEPKVLLSAVSLIRYDRIEINRSK